MGNISGYNADLTVGTYTGASLKNVSVTINGGVIDCSDLSTKWRQTAPDIASWQVTGTKGFTTEAFLTLMHAAVSGATSLGCTVKNPAGTTVWSGVGWITGASLTFPMGAAEETITVDGNGEPTTP